MELQELQRPKVGWLRRLRNRHEEGLDDIATQPSVFDDPVALEVYRPPPEYENAHRFDPKATWTWREEKRLIRKIDIRIMLWSCVMVFCLSLDRSNINQANTDNFLPDLGLTTNDFNLGNSVFRFAFVAAELPSQIVSKRIGPDVWIPMQITLWSIVSLSQYWLTPGRAAFLVTRVLIGFLEGGFIPDTVLYLSYFYTKTELPIRIGWFFVSSQYLSALIGAFLATGFLAIQNVTGTAGWRYLFLLEGILTGLVGITSFFMLPPGPTQTKAWFRPKGWFTERQPREEVIMVNRILRDDPYKSTMHNREGLTLRMILGAIFDWRMWPLYWLGFAHNINVGPPQTYLTLTLRQLGFNTTQSNLLTIPSIVIGLIGLIVTSYLAEWTNSRTFGCVLLQIWALPLLIALYTFNEQTAHWTYYIVVTLITGFPYVHPIQVAWTSRNSGDVQGRAVTASLYNICVQFGAIAYSNVYQASDAPLYKKGNLALIFVTVANILAYGLTWLFYRETNRRREAKWESMSEKEQQTYVETTTDRGNQRLDFRFAY
ncbi:MFS general substrate transporter [Coniophora puteana RWD-64-598 SS2]|uniref:MFS general substrate transporter n=1 Tax=Coniophora puteana (strain RWD-64-598) TaxID=741705 RepID=A0A5M3N766_CONPW|nr:MFS general substrate transporter [Coniophora puteana RWD-64-598 SS2]EIW87128.1 MFS general substrate transporter [Coniophora puteana RWD-64-598 SS2]